MRLLFLWPPLPPACLQIRIVIPPEMYVAGTHYAFVVYAMNGLTPSYPSNVIQVAT